MVRVYLGLGSNVGDGAAILRSAYAELSKLLANPRLSRLYRTKAMYVEDQPDFVNAAASGESSLSPRELLDAVNRIEAAFGRERERERFKGPRSLDIDILLYGSLIVSEPGLAIPHAGLRDRLFALLPLLDLDGSLRDPIGGEAYSELAAALPPQGIYLIE
jgi:2-amino-4-hydroxy-6-hydroxymethyldihydropteridine diphosphokinase